MKKYFPIVIFIMGFTGFICGQVAFDLIDQAKKEKLVHPALAQKYEKNFSNLSFETLAGKKLKLGEISAPIIMVNFWASWCTACLEEIPSIVDLRNKFKESELYILGINSDEENYLREIDKVAKKYNINFPNVADPTGGISSKFDVISIPLTIIFYQGKAINVFKGPQDFTSIEALNNFKNLIKKSQTVVKAN